MFTNNDTLSLFWQRNRTRNMVGERRYGFGAKVEDVKLADYTAYLCGKHLYFIEAGINENDMVALLDRYQQEPSFSPENIVGLLVTASIFTNRNASQKSVCTARFS